MMRVSAEMGDDLRDQLLAQLAAGEDWGRVANDLLRAFFRGYPLDELRPLLRSSNPEAVNAACFIAGELGGRALPIMDDVVPLLQHCVPRVRGTAAECVLVCGTEADGGWVAAVLALIGDAHRGVRWTLNQFLMRASIAQLRGALNHLERTSGDPEQVAGLRSLLSATLTDQDVLAMLTSTSPIIRKFGLAAVLRRGRPSSVLVHAVRSAEDEEIREFGEEELKGKVSDPPS